MIVATFKQIQQSTLTLLHEEILYNTDKEYRKLYDISETRDLNKCEQSRIQFLYRMYAVKLETLGQDYVNKLLALRPKIKL